MAILLEPLMLDVFVMSREEARHEDLGMDDTHWSEWITDEKYFLTIDNIGRFVTVDGEKEFITISSGGDCFISNIDYSLVHILLKQLKQ